jgi:hypothetical protein
MLGEGDHRDPLLAEHAHNKVRARKGWLRSGFRAWTNIFAEWRVDGIKKEELDSTATKLFDILNCLRCLHNLHSRLEVLDILEWSRRSVQERFHRLHYNGSFRLCFRRGLNPKVNNQFRPLRGRGEDFLRIEFDHSILGKIIDYVGVVSLFGNVSTINRRPGGKIPGSKS